MPTAWLRERLRGWNDAPALAGAGAVVSYADMSAAADRFAAELATRGVRAGQVVSLTGNLAPTTAALLLALFDLKAIAVPLMPATAIRHEALSELAQVEHAIVVEEDGSWQMTSPARAVTNALTHTLIARGHPGLILFSSGSTGSPKAVLHDAAALLGKFSQPRERKVTMTFMLIDHIGGIDTLFGTFASGGTVVTTPTRDPDTVCATIARHRVHTLPTSPTFLNLLMISGAWQHHDLSSLTIVAYGTEPMPAALLQRLRDALPHVRFVQTFGMSELGVLRTKPRADGSLWMKFTDVGYTHRIVDGVLWVKSPTAMLGYLNAPDLLDADGWLNTQDAVEVDGEWLRILGRVSDLINVGGEKVYPAEVESVLLEMENVKDVIVRGEPSPLTGHFVAAQFQLVTAEPLASLRRRMHQHCRGRLAMYQIPVRVEIRDADTFGDRFKKMRNG